MAPSALMAAMSPISPLLVRDVGGDINGVKNTFSSWDACMAKDYCKWPVIVAIVIGSLIVLSIVLCIVRCCCCGVECCCAACSCINACCPSPRGGRDRTKYRDPAPPPMPYQGYQPTPAPYYAAPTAPQFATFDASRKVNADSLPAMPSWDTSTSKKVLDDNHPEELEMQRTDQHDETAPMLANSATPRMGAAGASPYQDHPQDFHTQDGFHSQASMDGANVAAMSSGQGYRSPNGQRPGMPSPQNSFASSVPGNQGYAPNRPQQGFASNTYGQPSGHPTGYGNDQNQYGQQSYGASPPPQQNSYNFVPASGQTLGVAPRAPQPTYGGSQEYTRPSGGIPASLAPGTGPRGAAYNGQQSYQSYNGNQYQNQGQGWRDV